MPWQANNFQQLPFCCLYRLLVYIYSCNFFTLFRLVYLIPLQFGLSAILVCLLSWFVCHLGLSSILVCLPSWFVCYLGLSAILVCLLSVQLSNVFQCNVIFIPLFGTFNAWATTFSSSHSNYLSEIFQNKWVTDNPTMLLFLL